jgi:hypothetical protein
MAQNTNNEELKQQAILTLADGREEISAEVHRVRQHLRPARILQRVVDRHAGLIVVLAVTAGIIPVLLIFRGKRSADRVHSPAVISVAKPPPKPVLGALLLGALGIVARSITPTMIKSVLMPHVLDFIAKRQPEKTAANPLN